MRPGIQIAVLILCVTTMVCMLSAALPIKKDQQSQEFSDSDLEFFENKVRPLLVEKCFECHGPDADHLEGGLSLHSRAAILNGGDTGAAIVVGEAKQSLLIDAINYGDIYQMPPDSKLNADEISILTRWVEIGAPWPSEPELAVNARAEFDLHKRKADHWCWQPVKSPQVPVVEFDDWPRDDVDNFVLRRMEEAGLSPAESANRRTLIRRVYFDLIGLPPTPKEVQQFVNDSSPDAFAKVVDDLLASPCFGEHWARHWMDLTRYAESYGHEFDYEITHAYQYRDYLIRAFNQDVPYDQMIREHIAGDLLANPRRHPQHGFNESIIATGFWFLGEATHAPVDVRGDEAGRIDNQIDVMSKTFLGLTVACARCHDHKFDAISTEDYYALSGFLQSSRRQMAMLDHDRQIESTFEQAMKLVRDGDLIARELKRRITNPEKQNIEKYIAASLAYLRNDLGWHDWEPIRFQGEDLKSVIVSGGETRVQELKPVKGLQWEGEKQLWWLDGEIGDSLKLQFELTRESRPIDYEISADFTKAHDYGNANIFVDGELIKENVNFYEPKLAKTGRLQLGTLKLARGLHEIEFKLVDSDARAKPRNMVGLDWIELKPIPSIDEDEVQLIAKQKNVDQSLLVKFVTAIRSYAAGRLPVLDLLYESAKSDSDKIRNQIVERAQTHQKQFEKWQCESVLFADFQKGLPNDWFRTGYAFGADGNARSIFAPTGAVLRRDETVHSGIAGEKFWGVIRSPTFTLDHEQIHYRLRGHNIKIRLIVDGYQLDTFNNLLFKGATIDVDNSKDFAWHTQAEDLKNHRGHRAYIEILDLGNGFVELDEIRFSDHKPPPHHGMAQLAGFPDGKLEAAFAISGRLQEVLRSEPTFEKRELAAWIIEQGLSEVFSKGQNYGGESSRLPDKTDLLHRVSQGLPISSRSSSELAAELKNIRNKIQRLNQDAPDPTLAIAIADGTGEDEFVFVRGNHKTLGPVAARRFLSAVSDAPLDRSDGSGRLELAQKIIAAENPLTSRVIVNRIWHHLFGRGIVESVDNFGVLGKTPSHPQLLDHLATGFQADGWSVKRMIRRMVLTNTYQMSSQPDEAATTIDPGNELLYRARIKRLTGESIRDSILKISGELDPKMYGPSIPVYLTPFMQGRGRPEAGPLDGNGRRSVYVSVKRNFLSPMMLAFDTPIPFNTIGRRNRSNVPAQALILMNDPFVVEQAGKWAQRLSKETQTVSERISQIYWQALGRPPAEWESEQAIRFINQQADELQVSPKDLLDSTNVWRDLCHVMFNLKEFIFIK